MKREAHAGVPTNLKKSMVSAAPTSFMTHKGRLVSCLKSMFDNFDEHVICGNVVSVMQRQTLQKVHIKLVESGLQKAYQL
jgi:hypothetical protein